MATFGTTSPSGNSDFLGANSILGNFVTSPSDAGTLTSMSLYWNVENGSQHVKYVLYDQSGNFLAASAGGLITGTGFQSQNISFSLSPSTGYLIGCIFQENGTASNQYDFLNSGGPAKTSAAAGYASPANVTYTNVNNYTMTIFATYTPSGGGASKTFRTLLGVGI